MKTPEQRGVIGAWAFQARAEAGLSVEQVAESITAMGQSVTPATIRGVESGVKRPGARLLRLLGKVLDSAPPGHVARAGDQSDLTAAITRQTEAIDRLIDRLESLASSAIRDGVQDALREAGLDLDAGGPPSSPPAGPPP